jgi:hypothetical protein
MGIGEWCAGKARQAWWATTDLWKLIWACRAPFVAIAAGGLLIAQTDQARDIVIATSSPKEGGLPIPLAVLLWASMGWYWSRITLEFMKGEAARSPVPVDPEVAAWGWAPGWRCFWSDHLPRLIGAAAIFSVAVAFWRAHNVYARYGDFASAAIFLRQAAFYLVATGVFYAVVAYRKELMEWVVGSRRGDRWRRNLVPERAPLRQFNDIAPLAKWILYLSVLGSPVFFLLFAFVPIQTAALLGSAVAVILVGLALAVAAPSFLVIWSIRTRMPLLGTACVLFFVMPWLFGDNHDVRTCRALQSAGNAGKACVDKDYADRPFVRDVFNAWYEANKKITKPIEGPGTSAVAPPMIVVATAGGASRAAYFTTQVLGEIASREENFAERLFLLSGVSGGSLGATVFRSLVEVKRRSSVDKEGMVGLMKDAAKDGDTFIDHDFLAPALGVGFYVDAPYSAVSFLRSRWAPYDRAAALEKAWEAAWLESGISHTGAKFEWSDGLTRTFTKEAKRPWPILALNGTSVEKGKRIITSNVRFAIDNYRSQRNLSGGINRYDALEIVQSDIPISTAVTMSARFPIISPSGSMRDKDGKLVTRVVDGGLFENFGAVLADEVLRYFVERISEAQEPEHRMLVMPIAILISSDPSLDKLELQGGTASRKVNPDCLPMATEPVLHPGNGWPECPVDTAAKLMPVVVDPATALYDGRTARGELAATALRDRIVETKTMVRDRLIADVKDEALVNRRTGVADNDDFFHFRQCRVPDSKSPTMSWHDSGTAWKAMRRMLGLDAEPNGQIADPCGNKVEFFRLCVRLARLSGDATGDEEATRSCEAKWPRPENWECRPADNGPPRIFCGPTWAAVARHSSLDTGTLRRHSPGEENGHASRRGARRGRRPKDPRGRDRRRPRARCLAIGLAVFDPSNNRAGCPRPTHGAAAARSPRTSDRAPPCRPASGNARAVGPKISEMRIVLMMPQVRGRDH